jgi:hypothetical protein
MFKVTIGIVELGSRLNLKLQHIKSNHSANIMLELVSAIPLFGFPTFIRTDN